MNRTLLLARVGLAFLLVTAVAVLTGIVLLHSSSLHTDAKELLATLASALVTVMVFSVHAIYAHAAQQADVPSPNPTQGQIGPKA